HNCRMGRFDALTQLENKALQPPLKEGVLSSPFSGKHDAGLPANLQTSKDVNLQASKPANLQTRLHANLQTSKDENLQASKPANQQTGKTIRIEKYSTYLTPECKKGLKRIAFETERKDYEVLIEAVEQYLERKKQP